jgi:AcrR family transcriptional regulator
MNIIVDEKKIGTFLPKIMRAATRLFVLKGIEGTTTKDIAREAGVAEGALYRHFKGKEDLAWHIFQVHLNQFTNELMGKVLVQPNAKDRIRVFVEESFAAYESDPELYTYLILREHSELEKYADKFQHPGHVVMKIIEDGQKSGEIRTGEPYVLGSLFVGGVIRVAVVKMYGNLHRNLTTYVSDVADMIWAMLKVPGRLK